MMGAHVLQVNEIPEEFPFEIQDNPGERTITLTRKYEDETIKVEVDIPNDAAEDEEEDNNESDENDEETCQKSSIPLVVSISKDGGVCLEFSVTAYPDEISIDNLSIRNPDSSEDLLVYEGPEFKLVYSVYVSCSFLSLQKICSLKLKFSPYSFAVIWTKTCRKPSTNIL